MPVRVVVLLEMIDVRQQYREGTPEPARPLHLARERAHQVSTVVEPRERVRDRESLQLRVAFALAQARNQRVEHPREVAHLTHAGRRELDR